MTIHPFAVLRGSTRVETGAEIHPQHRRDRRARRRRGDRRSILLPSPWDGSRRVDAKAGTFVEIKNSTIGDRTKVPHLSYIGDADVGDGHECRCRRDHRELRAQARRAEGPHDDRQQRQDGNPQWLRRTGRGGGRSMDRSRLDHHARTSPPMRSGLPGHARRTRRGMQPGSATTELVLPGLESAGDRDPAAAGPLARARAAEAADGLLRAARTRRSPSASPSSSASSSARSSCTRSRTARRTAATTSRSAAPTSSSSRPAASRSTRT